MKKELLLSKQFVKDYVEAMGTSVITCRIDTSDVSDVGRYIGSFLPGSNTPLMDMFNAVDVSKNTYVNLVESDYVGVTGNISLQCVDSCGSATVYSIGMHFINENRELILHLDKYLVIKPELEEKIRESSTSDVIKLLIGQIKPEIMTFINRELSVIPTNLSVPSIDDITVEYLGTKYSLNKILGCDKLSIKNGEIREIKEDSNLDLPGVGQGSIRFGLFESAYVMSELKTVDNNYLSGKVSLNIDVDKYLEESAGDTKAILRDLLIVYLGSKNCICGSDVIIPNIDNVKVSVSSTIGEYYTIKELFPNRSLSIILGRLIDTTNINLEKIMGLFSGDDLKTVLNEYVRLQMKVTELDIANNSEETCRRWNNPLTY